MSSEPATPAPLPPLGPPPGPPPESAAPVLVVADEPADRARLAFVLRSAGYRPATCAPATVWRALPKARPALVLLTLSRPEGAGLALYRHLRTTAACAALPVVLLSAAPAAIVLAQTADCPPAGLVHRPCPASAVLAVVAEALAGRGGDERGRSERMERYTIRYRSIDARGRPALIVTDAAGDAYLFSDGALQLRRAGSDAAARLARPLTGLGAWTPVPPGPPYTLAGLRRLAGAAPPGAADGA